MKQMNIPVNLVAFATYETFCKTLKNKAHWATNYAYDIYDK